jgi:spore maturation protein CgeB
MRIVFLGLSVTSSWGNGHATNYRALLRALTERGHDVLFLERDVPWYAAERDMPEPPWGRTRLYRSLDELREQYAGEVQGADLVVVGSYVPDGVAVAEWATQAAKGATAFYDLDTPVTLAKLERGDDEYLSRALIPRFDLYLSFTGGPILRELEYELGARSAHAFHCLVDPEIYRPLGAEPRWDLGYLGTWSEDRQPQVDALLMEPARRATELRFVVAGPAYPPEIAWPRNVERREHVPPSEHARFYAEQRLTLNVTRADMRRAGWSPSVRLFEAAACGVAVVSDRWAGLETIFAPDWEILIADTPGDVLQALRRPDLAEIGARARERALREHSAVRRAEQLEELVGSLQPA